MNEELSSDKSDSLNKIDQNINVNCVSMKPDLFVASLYIGDDLSKYCLIRIRDTYTDVSILLILGNSKQFGTKDCN